MGIKNRCKLFQSRTAGNRSLALGPSTPSVLITPEIVSLSESTVPSPEGQMAHYMGPIVPYPPQMATLYPSYTSSAPHVAAVDDGLYSEEVDPVLDIVHRLIRSKRNLQQQRGRLLEYNQPDPIDYLS